jgi:hypothetical protein
MSSHLDDTVPFNFFSSTTGNTFISLGGVSSGDLPANTQTLGRTPTYTLTSTSRPYHPLSLVSTVTTGTIPRRHGIVNQRNTQSTALNLHDLARGLEDAKVVVGSSCKHFAQVLSSHEGSKSFFWNSKSNSFETLSGDLSILDKETLSEYIAALGYTYKDEAKIGDVAFDINDEVDKVLFAELAFVSAWTSKLRSVESRKFFAFHFASPLKIAEKYGKDSQQWFAALSAIDKVIAGTISGDSVLEVLYLPAYSTERTKTMNQVLTPVIADYVSDNLFPQLYLNEKGMAEQALVCQKIKDTLAADFADVTVFCPLHETEKRAISEVEAVTVDDKDVLAFHYVFWTMLVIIAAFLWAAYALAYIEPDESLYTASTYYKVGGKGKM